MKKLTFAILSLALITPAAAPATIVPVKISDDMTINFEIEFEDDYLATDDVWAAQTSREITQKLHAFDRALASMMDGHPAPTYPNPFTHVQNNYLFENKITILGDMDEYKKIDCFGNAANASNTCPFKTAEECAVWNKKPKISTAGKTQNNQTYSENDSRLCQVITELRRHKRLPIESESGQLLIRAHQSLMSSAASCCMNAVSNEMRRDGAPQTEISNFAAADSENLNFSARCLTLPAEEIDAMTGGGRLAEIFHSAQRTCTASATQKLKPFMQLFAIAPDIAQMPLDYTFRDKYGRTQILSITNDISIISTRAAQ